MKTRNRRYPYRLKWKGENLENRERFYFPDASQISALVGDQYRQMKTQNLYRRGRRRWITLITNPPNCWAPVPLSQINMVSLENLGQTSGGYPIYPQNLAWSAKSKIPDRLGFSRHMKTRLYNGYITLNKEAC